MKKHYRVELQCDGQNIRIETYAANIDGRPTIGALITVGAKEDEIGGRDGEDIFMNTVDFSEFVNECQNILNVLMEWQINDA